MHRFGRDATSDTTSHSSSRTARYYKATPMPVGDLGFLLLSGLGLLGAAFGVRRVRS